MLKFKNLSICLLLLFAVGCSQDAVEPQQNIQSEKLSTIKVNDNKALSSLLDDLQAYSANHRTALTGLNFDSLSEAIQLNPDSKAGSVYSILIKNNNPRKFVNLVLSSTESVTYSYLLEFTSANIIYSNSMRDFTGSMRVMNLEGKVMDSYQVEKGIFSRKISNSNRSIVHCTHVTYVDYQDADGNPCDPYESDMSGEQYDPGNSVTWRCFEVVKVDFNCPPSIVPSGSGGGGGGSSTGSTGSSSGVGGGGSGSSSSSSSSGSTGSGGGSGSGNDGDKIEEFETPIFIDFETYAEGELLEEQIDDSELEPCMQEILNDLKLLNNGVGQIIQQFTNGDVSGNYNWKLSSGSLNGENALTLTNNETIIDHDVRPNATELSWARTILHEAVHAYLISWEKDNRDYETRTEHFDWLFKDYALSELSLNEIQHNEFIRSFVSDIAAALKEYGEMKNYHLPDQFYNDLAWGGLTHSERTDEDDKNIEMEWFLILNPNKADRDRINDVINTELTGNDFNGNESVQKGKRPDCWDRFATFFYSNIGQLSCAN